MGKTGHSCFRRAAGAFLPMNIVVWRSDFSLRDGVAKKNDEQKKIKRVVERREEVQGIEGTNRKNNEETETA